MRANVRKAAHKHLSRRRAGTRSRDLSRKLRFSARGHNDERCIIHVTHITARSLSLAWDSCCRSNHGARNAYNKTTRYNSRSTPTLPHARYSGNDHNFAIFVSLCRCCCCLLTKFQWAHYRTPPRAPIFIRYKLAQVCMCVYTYEFLTSSVTRRTGKVGFFSLLEKRATSFTGYWAMTRDTDIWERFARGPLHEIS